jgi:hypothetical protein
MAARKLVKRAWAGALAEAVAGAGFGAVGVAVAVAEELCSISTAEHGGVTSERVCRWDAA